MDKLEGVRVGLILAGNGPITHLKPGLNGYLGKIKPFSDFAKKQVAEGKNKTGMKLAMHVGFDDAVRGKFTGLFSNNKKQVTPKANYYVKARPGLTPEMAAKDGKRIGDGKAYTLMIPIKWSRLKKTLHAAEYPFNALTLLKLEGNVVERWEISVTSHAGDFYLNVQKIYTWTLYKGEVEGENKVVREGIETYDTSLADWPQMTEFMEKTLKARIGQFPAYDYERVLLKPVPEVFPEGVGRVDYWTEASGKGAIKVTVDGQSESARVHWSQIFRVEGDQIQKKFLKAGELVRVRELKAPKTTSRATKFKFEAYGVELAK